MKFTKWVGKRAKPIFIIMRGIPGAGKSHKVQELLNKFGGVEDHVFSADKYFTELAKKKFKEEHGRSPTEKEILDYYKMVWNRELAGEAHSYCFDKFKAAVDAKVTPIILDNTNTTKIQFERYFKYAENSGYEVRIEEPNSPWWRDAREDLGVHTLETSEKLRKLKDILVKRGQHGVPEDTIQNLIDKVWQNTPTGSVTYQDIFQKE